MSCPVRDQDLTVKDLEASRNRDAPIKVLKIVLKRIE